MILRPMKHIFEKDTDTLIEAFLISIEEVGKQEPYEVLNYYVGVLLKYFSEVKKEITEEQLKQKLEELEGKGKIIMTILEQRELKGREQGIEQGIEQGRLEERIVVARNLLAKGIGIDIVQEATGLTQEDIIKNVKH